MDYGLVSIIMLSSNSGSFVEKSVESVIAQTYKNWELLFVDDASMDDTVKKVMKYMCSDPRIKVSHMVFQQGSTMVVNNAMKEAQGRWMAFISADCVWEPEKLKQQITFMKENGYAFSYTKFGMGTIPAYVVGGPEVLSHGSMMKCCWPAYSTVMYDAEKAGEVMVKDLNENNNYALWLTISKKTDCHLLPECLAKQLRIRRRFSPLPLKGKFRWRYEVYRIVEGKNQIMSLVMTYRNFYYTIWKRVKFVER